MTIHKPHSVQDFNEVVAEIEANPGYKRPVAFGIGIGRTDKKGNFLEVFYPCPNFQNNFGTAAIMAHVLGWDGEAGFRIVELSQIQEILSYFEPFKDDGKEHKNIDALHDMRSAMHRGGTSHSRVVVAFIDTIDSAPLTVPDAYLRLHLLSHRLTTPNTINVKPGELIPVLPNVAWTSDGPIAVDEINELLIAARIDGRTLRVFGVDKLPHMLDYVVPSGVRIADTARVRLGAYLGAGTTVMPSGFVNFNAGTLGKGMIEGRVSQGVSVGDGSDLGGASSTQGTMSGGSNVRVTVGERTLIGALAGAGISLGDDCIVAAGVYVMPSTEVTLVKEDGSLGEIVKAHTLSGHNGLLFVREGDGILYAKPNNKAVELNPLLHAN